MIQLVRIRTEMAIPAAFRGIERVAYNIELLKKQREKACNTKYKFEFTDIWGKAKPQLMKEANYKCAYCEKPIGTSDKKGIQATSYADVEHYRPKKGGYEWLAYCYDNYLYACEVCNRSYKKSFFPILNEKYETFKVNCDTIDTDLQAFAPNLTPDPLTEAEGMAWTDFEQAHLAERPLLFNPYYDNPEDFLGYEYDLELNEVSVFVLSTIDNHQLYQIALESYYGLNRTNLLTDRYTHFRLFFDYKELLKMDISTSANQICLAAIERMKESKYPYSGMIRYFDKTYS